RRIVKERAEVRPFLDSSKARRDQNHGASELPGCQDVLEVWRIAEMNQRKPQVLVKDGSCMQAIESGNEWQKPPHRARGVLERDRQGTRPERYHPSALGYGRRSLGQHLSSPPASTAGSNEHTQGLHFCKIRLASFPALCATFSSFHPS